MKTLSDIQKRLESTHWPARSDAVKALEGFKIKDILPILVIAIKDKHKYIRQAAIELMSKLAKKEFRDLLESCLLDGYHYNRELAFGGLVKIYQPDLFPILEAAIDRKGEQIKTRISMIWSLGQLTDTVFTPIIIKWAKKMPLESSNIYTLMEVVKASKDRRMIPTILELGMRDKLDPNSKSWMVNMLGILKAREGIDYILQHAGHEFATDVYSDSTCLEALVEIDAAGFYLEILDHYKGRKQNLLIEAIGLLKYKEATDTFLQKLEKTKDINCRIALAKALQKLGYKAKNKKDKLLFLLVNDSWEEAQKEGPEACEILGQVSKCYHNKLARKALQILGEIGQVDDLEVLFHQIHSKDARKSMNAIEALGKIGSTDAIPHLVKYIVNTKKVMVSYDSSKEKAIRALGNIGDLSVIPFLIELLNNDPSIGHPHKETNNGRALLQTLVELYAQEAIPTIVKYLTHQNQILREEAQKALEAFNWKPDHLQNKIRALASKQKWEDILKMGSPAVKPLIGLTSQESIFGYEKLMLTLAKIGDQRATKHILLWLFKPYYHLHTQDNISKLSPYFEPLFGEISTKILKASSFIDCKTKEKHSSSSYSYSLKTAIKATQALRKSSEPLAQKALEYLSFKKPIELVELDHDEYGCRFIEISFEEQQNI